VHWQHWPEPNPSNDPGLDSAQAMTIACRLSGATADGRRAMAASPPCGASVKIERPVAKYRLKRYADGVRKSDRILQKRRIAQQLCTASPPTLREAAQAEDRRTHVSVIGSADALSRCPRFKAAA
jgi:hypothetical protein